MNTTDVVCSTFIDWEKIEETCMNTPGLPNCIPQNIRQWDTFIRQYERVEELISGKWQPHYDWENLKEFTIAVDEQFYLGKGYKHSIYECFLDLSLGNFFDLKNKLIVSLNDINCDLKNKLIVSLNDINWGIIKKARLFTYWGIRLNNEKLNTLPLVPKKVGGIFSVKYNNLTSLKGCPEYVGGDFNCSFNKLTSLQCSPKYVGGDFDCSHNELSSIKGCPEYVGNIFECGFNQKINNVPCTIRGKYLSDCLTLAQNYVNKY